MEDKIKNFEIISIKHKQPKSHLECRTRVENDFPLKKLCKNGIQKMYPY